MRWFVFVLLANLILPAAARGQVVPYGPNPDVSFSINFTNMSDPAALTTITGLAGYTRRYLYDVNVLSFTVYLGPAPATGAQLVSQGPNEEASTFAELTNQMYWHGLGFSPFYYYSEAFGLTTNEVHTLLTGSWYVFVQLDGTNYCGTLRLQTARPPTASITVSPLMTNHVYQPPRAFVVAPDNRAAPVQLDVSPFDPYYFPLRYRWVDGSSTLATAASTSLLLKPGVHNLSFELGDGFYSNAYNVHVTVLTPGQAVETLVLYLDYITVPTATKARLSSFLAGSAAAFNRGDMMAGGRLLSLFQKQVALLPAPDGLAAELILNTQQIADTVDTDSTPPMRGRYVP